MVGSSFERKAGVPIIYITCAVHYILEILLKPIGQRIRGITGMRPLDIFTSLLYNCS